MAGQFDRLASARLPKSTPPVETPSATAALVAPKLPLPLFKEDTNGSKPTANGDHKALTNGHGNGLAMPSRPKFVVQPLHNLQPLNLNNENATDLHLLTLEEQQLCSVLRIMPKPYLVMKEHILKEAQKSGGSLKKKVAREICRVCLTNLSSQRNA
jgi:transcriptional adapter 2-alpha